MADLGFSGVPKRLQTAFERSLHSYAKNVLAIMSRKKSISLTTLSEIQKDLKTYAEQSTPWVEKLVDSMTQETLDSTLASWKKAGILIQSGIGRDLKAYGSDVLAHKQEVVSLIQSIPIDSSQKVHELALEAMRDGLRAEGLRETATNALSDVASLARSRSQTIAKTEIVRAHNMFVKTQAESVGCDGFVSRSSNDGDQCPICKKLHGKIFSFDKGYTLNGVVYKQPPYHPNCNCYIDPVF